MALITKNYTFSVGATIIAAQHNANFDTIYNDYNGNITNANLAGSFNLDESKVGQLVTYGKVAGTAITQIDTLNALAGIIPTANLPLISMVSGVTSGPLATVYGGSGSTANSNTTGGVLIGDPAVKSLIGIDAGNTNVSAGHTTVTFNFTFASAPIVLANWNKAADGATSDVYVYSSATTGCTLVTPSTPGNVNWIAIGTKA